MRANIVVLLILFRAVWFIRPVAAADEADCYRSLQDKLKEYIDLLSEDPSSIHDAVNSMYSSRLINEYRDLSAEYLAVYKIRPPYRVDRKLLLPSKIVQVFWTTDDPAGGIFLVNISGVALGKFVGESIETEWERKLPGIFNVCLVDLEDDGRDEIIAVAEDYYYIIRRSKQDRILFSTLSNQQQLKAIYKINGQFLGVYYRKPDRTSVDAGWYLGSLNWIHPGFGINRDLMKLPGNIYQLDRNGRLVTLGELDSGERLLQVYSYKTGEGVTGGETVSAGGTGVPVAVMLNPVDDRELCFVTTDSATLFRNNGNGYQAQSKIDATMTKQAWMFQEPLSISNALFLCLDYANQLIFWKGDPDTRPLFQ
ncbi:MAG: hypothetical protein PHQ23_01450 [Candidatus Wallbacteria bacterium]|nr:hypothetical protein [Candidatus Wallbacteria bacterium]